MVHIVLVLWFVPKAGYALMESHLTIFLRIDISDVAHVDAPESKIT